jgi:hypothetical protein
MYEKDLTEIVRDRIDAEGTEISYSDIEETVSGNYAVYRPNAGSGEIYIVDITEDESGGYIPEKLEKEIVKELSITRLQFRYRGSYLLLRVKETSTAPEDRDPTRELAEHFVSEV